MSTCAWCGAAGHIDKTCYDKVMVQRLEEKKLVGLLKVGVEAEV